MRCFSGSFRTKTPTDSSDSGQTPPVSAPVTPTTSRLNPNAASFQPASDNSSTNTDSSGNDSNNPDSLLRPLSPMISPIPCVNQVYGDGIRRMDNLLQRTTSFESVREAIEHASQQSLTLSPSLNTTSASDNTASPLIVVSPAVIPSPITAPSPVVSMSQHPGASFVPLPPMATAPPSPFMVASNDCKGQIYTQVLEVGCSCGSVG
jgi:hypothetical protein